MLSCTDSLTIPSHKGDHPFSLTQQSIETLKLALTVKAATDTKRGTSLATQETGK